MSTTTSTRRLLATVDALELKTIRWGPLRQIFPTFVEEIELGRYLKSLQGSRQCATVEIAPHRGWTHVLDVFEYASRWRRVDDLHRR